METKVPIAMGRRFVLHQPDVSENKFGVVGLSHSRQFFAK